MSPSVRSVSNNDKRARDRLNRILADEVYGPALVRLRPADERKALDLIDQNRGQEARAFILEADKKRKETAQKKRINNSLPELRQAAFNNIMFKLGKARVAHVRENVDKLLTPAQLRWAANASTDDLIREARKQPRVNKPGTTIAVNPFWYN